MIRIDAITVKLSVYEEFEGHRDVEFPVSTEDAVFVAAVTERWRRWSEQLIAQLKSTESMPGLG